MGKIEQGWFLSPPHSKIHRTIDPHSAGRESLAISLQGPQLSVFLSVGYQGVFFGFCHLHGVEEGEQIK